MNIEPGFAYSITELPYGLGDGKIFRCMMPGYKAKILNIEEDISALKAKNISHIALLATDAECIFVTHIKLREKYLKEGFSVTYFPIPDRGIPDNGDLSVLLAELQHTAAQGKNTAIHCMGGNGRTGLVCACLARKIFNISGQEAVLWVRQVIPNAVETKEQIACVAKFLEEESLSFFEKSLVHLPFDLTSGNIFCCQMPGYQRVKPDIQQDIEKLKNLNITHVLNLATEEECHAITTLDLKKEYINAGLIVLDFPIKDQNTPDIISFNLLMEQVQTDLSNGANIAVHCLSGTGRTSLFLSCLARKILNLPRKEAVAWVRESIPKTVETPSQKKFIENFILGQKETPFSKSLIYLPFIQKGKIYRSVMPATFTKSHIKENLFMDFLTLKANNISHIALLSSDEECLDVLGINLKKEYQKRGFIVRHLPIMEASNPIKMELEPFIQTILSDVKQGMNYAIHCRGGTGRTGLVAACMARILFKFSGVDALQWIRKYIPGAVQTEDQEEYVRKYF